MRVLAVDDESLQLEKLEDAIYEAKPDAMVFSICRTPDVLRVIEEITFDVAFLDVQMRGMTGIQVAEKLKEKNPKINIIFVTAYDDFKGQAMDLRASGYITKPVSAAKISAELESLRYQIEEAVPGSNRSAGMYPAGGNVPADLNSAIGANPAETQPSAKASETSQPAGNKSSVFGAFRSAFGGSKQQIDADTIAAQYTAAARGLAQAQSSESAYAQLHGMAYNQQSSTEYSRQNGALTKKQPLLYIQCFGNFDAFDQNHKPIRFERSKAKEMLAYLVFRHGSRCSNREIAVMLFEEHEYDARTQDSFRHVASAMMKALKKVGAESAILKDSQNYAIDVNQVDCDYFRFLAADPTAKVSYSGDFMSQYSWAEYVNAYLDSQI